MIRGWVGQATGYANIDAEFIFPDHGNITLPLTLVIDTGASYTMIGPADALKLTALGLPYQLFDDGGPLYGLGGRAQTRAASAILRMIDTDMKPIDIPLEVHVLETPGGIRGRGGSARQNVRRGAGAGRASGTRRTHSGVLHRRCGSSFPLPFKFHEPYAEGGRRTPSVLGRQVLTAFTLIVAWPTDELYLR